MGRKNAIEPIAPVEENTTRIAAGPVTLALEMRRLNPEIVAEFYKDRADVDKVKDVVAARDRVLDDGPTIHVFGTDDGLEYLRFDCFANEPHYHYMKPAEDYHEVFEIDTVALGDPFVWAVDRLRHRLGEMLAESGGAALAAQLGSSEVSSAIDKLTELYESVA